MENDAAFCESTVPFIFQSLNQTEKRSNNSEAV